MQGSTKQRLVTAAAELLDQGGQESVTLRAVAEQVGVSHNAPYRHFRDRSALLAGVARHDFATIGDAFQRALTTSPNAASAMKAAVVAFTAYGLAHRARYRLLFSDPSLPADEELKKAAFAPFETFVRIVSWGQAEKNLPPSDPVALSGLIFAAMHGALDLEIGGRAAEGKGLGSVMATFELMVRLLKPDSHE
jgi:AcrR family transcriptional regulator